MNIENLNKIVEYIEDNLTEEIDYKNLAGIIGLNEQVLNKIFIFLLDMSLSEYIRKRRLSRAFEELRRTDIKILDLALKYQYDSDISFTRAFKGYFGITPSDCRKNTDSFILFPKANFTKINNTSQFQYKIVYFQSKSLYCLSVENESYEDFLYEIRELYNKAKDKQWYKDRKTMYGVTILEDNKYKYYLGSEEEDKNSIKITIPEGQYVVFEIDSREQEDITRLYKSIYAQWINSTSLEIDMNYTFELYDDEKCYVYITLK